MGVALKNRWSAAHSKAAARFRWPSAALPLLPTMCGVPTGTIFGAVGNWRRKRVKSVQFNYASIRPYELTFSTTFPREMTKRRFPPPWSVEGAASVPRAFRLGYDCTDG